MSILSRVGAVAAAAALLAPAAALAGTAGPQNFQVTASVVPMCTNLSATDMTFGNYNTFSSTPGLANATVSFQCTVGTSPRMNVSPGNNNNANGSGGQQHSMKSASGNNYLKYDILSASASFWYNNFYYYITQAGAPFSSPVAPLTSSSMVNVTLYGRVLALQDVPVGSYSDTVQVTLQY